MVPWHQDQAAETLDLLDRGVDISIVSRILGHEQIATTAKYDRRPEAAKRRAAQEIHIPYRRRVRSSTAG